MKLALPVENKTIEGDICISFGRTPYFLIYDTETKNSIFLDNTAANSQGGAGIKAAQTLVDSKVEALVTPRCGENAAQVLQAADIKIFKSIYKSIKENIDAFIEEKLPLLNEIHAGFHGGK